MKKVLSILLCTITLFSVVACGSKEETYSFNDITAKELVELMKDEGFPISESLSYDEETDPNELLGKPNEYIEKVDFEDTVALDRKLTMEINGEVYKMESQYDTPYGGTIEVFETSEDAEARYDYIDSVAHSGPLSTYMYLYDKVFIRLEKSLTKEEAEKYEQFFEKIDNGEIKKKDK